ncbi:MULTISPECIES: ribonuclease III [Vitreoscilla]|uniref:Ribonuclease 3 n=1 Tax=Vitreoscilla stercoraria TaxID=61 RepID=A0ABY4E867_VITST|nr:MULTISPECIES: ribonuclease III [Vitreoscilla]AUZ04790.1 ribonuclease 3 [Vitreoscilla sp. C1]UOO91536.1 ribonuclease III [Vitreoscilla stercoraria]
MSLSVQRNQEIERLQKKLGYRFKRVELLHKALTHRSYGAKNNERLEFIGDSILNYTVAKMLFLTFPDMTEGELSRLRANLVNQDTLADIATELNVGDCLFLGVGELKSGGFRRPSILADAMEAMFAAVSFDANFDEAEHVVTLLFQNRIRNIDLRNHGKDAKTLLQEALQARRLPLPKYRIEDQFGEAHEQTFVIVCDLGELGFQCKAQAHSRRLAEQAAAKEALNYVEKKCSFKRP